MDKVNVITLVNHVIRTNQISVRVVIQIVYFKMVNAYVTVVIKMFIFLQNV